MQKPKPARILIVEDELHIAEGLKLNLRLKGHEVALAEDGAKALRLWKDWNPDLIVLDIMLPVIDGLSVLKNIRLEDEKLPILILSAKSGADDRIKGLSFGVDDYLTKPFHLDEFLLRVERLLTRHTWTRESLNNELSCVDQIYRFGDNKIDFTTGKAKCRKGTIQLTDQELKLMKLFITHKGKPVSRNKLLEIGWGYSGKTSTRTIDNFVVRLRKYFEQDPKNPVYFRSIRSVGYVFDDGHEFMHV